MLCFMIVGLFKPIMYSQKVVLLFLTFLVLTVFYLEMLFKIYIYEWAPRHFWFGMKSWITDDRQLIPALKTCLSLQSCILVDNSRAFPRSTVRGVYFPKKSFTVLENLFFLEVTCFLGGFYAAFGKINDF